MDGQRVTFSETVKAEICSLQFDEPCFFAVLKALIEEQDPGAQKLATITTQMVRIFKFLRENLNRFLPEATTNIYYGHRQLTTRRKYLMEIVLTDALKTKLKLCNFRRYDCCRAYMAGVFLSCGSVSDPEGKYNHLELRLRHEAMVPVVEHLLRKFKIQPRHISYRDYEVVYIKKTDQIADFLKLVSATEQFYDFENLKIARDFGVNIQRLTNLEVSNVKRTIQANEALLQLYDQVQQIPRLRIKLTQRDVLYFQLIRQDPSQSLRTVAEVMSKTVGQRVSKNILHHTRQKIINLLKTVDAKREG